MSIPLAFDRIDGAAPERTIAFLHGILGRGNNLRTIARRFVEAQPGWSALLVDLRGHGRSPKGSEGPSLEAAARDIGDLVRGVAPPVTAMAGHSFGGKVGMEAVRIGEAESLKHLVVIDSCPGSRAPVLDGSSPLTVIEVLESLPKSFASRNDFIEALIASGQTRILAQWLAQSTEQIGDRVRFSLDLDETRALILDYFAQDLWSVVENPPDALKVHLVIADRSTAFLPADRERAAAIAAANPRVTVDVLPAGHWVHVDDPDGLLRVLIHRIAASAHSSG